mmetsp:Transcript_13319/g.41783  ORF Transcript_13319/g.41783 Transcript_13319/m.41783 type:complete len:224 (-) Transcript_13319:377-1048(-)
MQLKLAHDARQQRIHVLLVARRLRLLLAVQLLGQRLVQGERVSRCAVEQAAVFSVLDERGAHLRRAKERVPARSLRLENGAQVGGGLIQLLHIHLRPAALALALAACAAIRGCYRRSAQDVCVATVHRDDCVLLAYHLALQNLLFLERLEKLGELLERRRLDVQRRALGACGKHLGGPKLAHNHRQLHVGQRRQRADEHHLAHVAAVLVRRAGRFRRLVLLRL